MNNSAVIRAVLTELARQNLARAVPVGISARHVHLSERDIEVLFGPGYKLNPIKDLQQPGQFAAREQVTVVGPKGKLEHVRVLGPARKESQIEVSVSDSFVLGVKKCPVRLSGDLDGTPGVTLIGPKGQVSLDKGLMIAARHLHMSAAQAAAFGIKNGQVIDIKVTGARECVLQNVICRTGDGHTLELHLDTDEANAVGLSNNDIVEIINCAQPMQAPRITANLGAAVSQAIAQVQNAQKAQQMQASPVQPMYQPQPVQTVQPMQATQMVENHIMSSQPFYAGNPLVARQSYDTVAYAGNPTISDNTAPLWDDLYYSGNPDVTAESNWDNHGWAEYGGNLSVMQTGSYSGVGAGYQGNATIASEDAVERANSAYMNINTTNWPDEWKQPTPAIRNAFDPLQPRRVPTSEQAELLDLVTEANINDAYRAGKTQVYCTKKALVTPSAYDRAIAAGVEIVKI